MRRALIAILVVCASIVAADQSQQVESQQCFVTDVYPHRTANSGLTIVDYEMVFVIEGMQYTVLYQTPDGEYNTYAYRKGTQIPCKVAAKTIGFTDPLGRYIEYEILSRRPAKSAVR